MVVEGGGVCWAGAQRMCHTSHHVAIDDAIDVGFNKRALLRAQPPVPVRPDTSQLRYAVHPVHATKSAAGPARGAGSLAHMRF